MSTLDDILSEGLEHHRAGRFEPAEKLYLHVLSTDPDNSEALHFLGLLSHQTGDQHRAISLIERAIAGNSKVAKYHGNLGSAFNALERQEEALACYDTARQLDPTDAGFPYNAGTVLASMGQAKEAAEQFQLAIQLRPNYAEARVNLAATYSVLSRNDDAELEARTAIELSPDSTDAHYGLAQILLAQRRFSSAAESYWFAWQKDSKNIRAAAGLLNARLAICDWRDHDVIVEHIRKAITERNPEIVALGAFGALSLPISQHELSTVARMRTSSLLKGASSYRLPKSVESKPKTKSKIRIGFLSNDFRDHPVGHLISALFSVQKSSGIETYAYSTGTDDNSCYRRRVEEGADKFIDLRRDGHLSAEVAANRISADGIDILVDLGGLVQGARPDIIAQRPAPLLVAWLGFPGTTGGLHDYMIVGPDLVTQTARPSFTEALVTLPLGWMIPDDSLARTENNVSRHNVGLPDNGPVLCCFNSAHKIEPKIFAIWMRVLARAPEAVLWFRLGNDAFSNLQTAASNAGIDPQRLINAPRMPDKADHLARHACADLFLDTLTFNAHSTALDALWAGVPLITCPGETFQSRVVAATLRAAGIEDLVVADISDYEEKVVELCQSPKLLTEIKARLASGINCSAFQTIPFVIGLENALTEMWHRHTTGLEPTDFSAPSYE
jgi:protein O-GlcNAc transferase